MGLRPLEIFLLMQRGDRLEMSESDVYRRQILTTKVDLRAAVLLDPYIYTVPMKLKTKQNMTYIL